MTEYALLLDNTFQEIRSFEEKPVDIPHKLATWHAVSRQQRPAPTLTQDPAESWSLVNGVWTQAWAMLAVSPEEVAERQQRAADSADTALVKADAFVQNFIAMTPSGVVTYVENNTANLAEVRDLLKKMALMLLALARKQYR